MSSFTWHVPDAAILEQVVEDAPIESMARIDHVAAGLARLSNDWRDKQHMIDVLTCFLERYNGMEDVAQDLWALRSLGTANSDDPTGTVGAQLEQIGAKVGQPRNGLNNADYQRYISARIATSNSNGRDEDLIRIAVLIINDPAAYILLRSEPIATSSMQISKVTIDANLADILVQFLRLAVASGVRFLLQTSPVLPAATFTFAGGTGLGFGTRTDVNQPTLTAYGATGATGGKLSNVRE